MASGATLRIATLAVLLLLFAAVAFVLRMRRIPPSPTSMPALSHIEELRQRLLVVAATVLAGTVLSLTVRLEPWKAIVLPRPSLYDPFASQLFAAIAEHTVPPGVQLVATSPMDGFMAQFTLAFAVGITLAIPVALLQARRFLLPALRPTEQRFLAWIIVPALALFAAGAAFGYLVVLPATLAALYQFTDALGAQGLLQVRELASFVLSFVIGFGVAFQTPLVMVALAKIGVVRPASYWKFWRHAVVAILAAAMILTPDPTIVSQLMLGLPLIGLYILGAAVSATVAPPVSQS